MKALKLNPNIFIFKKIKYLLILFITSFTLLNCKTQNHNSPTNKNSLETKVENSKTFQKKDSIKPIINDSNTIDSLFIGAKFYKFDAFKGYKYIDKEKSEFIETNSDLHSSQLIVLENEDHKFLCLISGNDLVDNHDYIWERMESTLDDVYEFDKNLEICWYPNNKNKISVGTVAIGVNTGKILETNINSFETINPTTLLKVDYKKGKIIIKEKNTTIYCSDGY